VVVKQWRPARQPCAAELGEGGCVRASLPPCVEQRGTCALAATAGQLPETTSFLRDWSRTPSPCPTSRSRVSATQRRQNYGTEDPAAWPSHSFHQIDFPPAPVTTPICQALRVLTTAERTAGAHHGLWMVHPIQQQPTPAGLPPGGSAKLTVRLTSFLGPPSSKPLARHGDRRGRSQAPPRVPLQGASFAVVMGWVMLLELEKRGAHRCDRCPFSVRKRKGDESCSPQFLTVESPQKSNNLTNLARCRNKVNQSCGMPVGTTAPVSSSNSGEIVQGNKPNKETKQTFGTWGRRTMGSRALHVPRQHCAVVGCLSLSTSTYWSLCWALSR
jgi:hypothetical protein